MNPPAPKPAAHYRSLTLAQIGRALDLLLVGRIGLHQVPLELCSWYWAGEADADTLLRERIALLERERVVFTARLAELDAVAETLPPVPYIDPDPAAPWPRPILREAFA